MNKSLSDLLDRARAWPADAQQELEQVARAIEAELGLGVYQPNVAERDGIERGLRDSASGKFATSEQVEAVFLRHRRT